VINIVEFITNGVVLREAWGQAMQALGKPAQLSGGAIVIFNIWGFLVGIAAVWLSMRRSDRVMVPDQRPPSALA